MSACIFFIFYRKEKSCWLNFFFFQAEDGIRDADVTGVQTCALPICRHEACLGEDAEVRTDGVHVQTEARSKLAGVERRLSLLQEFEDSHTAWVAQCAMERRTLLSGGLARRPCHDQIVSTSWV